MRQKALDKNASKRTNRYSINKLIEVGLNQALYQAYETHQDALLGFIQKRLGDPSLSADLLHDLYIKIQSLPVEEEIKYPKAYLYRMANNLVIDQIRRQSKTASESEYDVGSQLDENSPEKIADYVQQLDIVTQAVNELPDKTRDVFKLQRLQQVDKADVANKMGISVNMVEKHLRKALAYCREKLNKLES